MRILFLGLAFFSNFCFSQNNKLLFDPSQNSFHTFIEKDGYNYDPDSVFTFQNNIIHVKGNKFGYICSNKSYKNFKLSMQFKWGEKKYPPREKEKRDAGILYHVQLQEGDRIWPQSVEYQIQEGDCGDFWLVDSVTITTQNKTSPLTNFHRIPKIKNYEKSNGEWNNIVIVSENGNLYHFLNGKKVNEGFKCSLQSGYILLQSEGAELYYRNIFIEELP